jgi:AcrR family transcriptional regulator
MPRPYRLDKRAERRDETRQRIVDAAIWLHQTIGPAATTLTEIAERANVGRVTVYRHFPDEEALARACSGHYFALHPLPDVEAWRTVGDARERLHAGLTAAYAYHRETEPMIARALADSRDHPVMEPYHAYWHHAADVLSAPFGARGGRRKLLRAGIVVALAFDTWRALVRDEGLDEAAAVEVAARLAVI